MGRIVSLGTAQYSKPEVAVRCARDLELSEFEKEFFELRRERRSRDGVKGKSTFRLIVDPARKLAPVRVYPTDKRFSLALSLLLSSLIELRTPLIFLVDLARARGGFPY